MWLLADTIDLNGDGVTQGLETVIGDVIILSIFVGAVIAIIRGSRGVNKFFRRINAFFDDWYGTPEEDGEDAHPGVLSRLHSLETTRQDNLLMLQEISNTLKLLQGQIQQELDQGKTTKAAAEEAMRIAKEIQQAQEEAARYEARWHAKFLHDQSELRREWASILEVVTQMIGKKPEEQLLMWEGVVDAFHVATASLIQPPEGEEQ